MDNNKKNWSIIAIAVVIVVLAIVAIAMRAKSPATEPQPAAQGGSEAAVSTSSEASTSEAQSPSSSSPAAVFAYSVMTATTTYPESATFKIIVSVLNLTDQPQTLSFKNGCQGDYSIAGFDMLAHTTCLPSPSSFVVKPHDIKQVVLMHYPSVFKIPPGSYRLSASIIGYGGSSVPIIITK